MATAGFLTSFFHHLELLSKKNDVICCILCDDSTLSLVAAYVNYASDSPWGLAQAPRLQLSYLPDNSRVMSGNPYVQLLRRQVSETASCATFSFSAQLPGAFQDIQLFLH